MTVIDMMGSILQPDVENIEAEQALLGALLSNNSIYFILEGLESVHFKDELHQRIYEAICSAIASGKTADAISMKSQFDNDPSLFDIGGGGYLIKLVACAVHVTNPKDYAATIIDLAGRRKVIAACQEAISTAVSSNESAGVIVESLLASLDDCDSNASIVNDRVLWERLYGRLSTNVQAFSTGICRLDEAMGGGVYPGMMYGFVARKKTGKTMLATTLSDNLADNGVKHLYLALEMGGERIHQRSAARKLGISEAAFRLDYGKSTDCLNRVAEATLKAGANRLWLDSARMKVDALQREVIRAIRRHKITGFIVDSWQLVEGKRRGQSTSEHLDEVAQTLAEICMKYKVWCIVTAQENQDENTRGGEGLRLACDQVYRIMKPIGDDGKPVMESTLAWLEMMDTRYTAWNDVGSDGQPSLQLVNGTHFEPL